MSHRNPGRHRNLTLSGALAGMWPGPKVWASRSVMPVLILPLLLFFTGKTEAQKAGPEAWSWHLGGYVKQMNGLYYLPDVETYFQDQLWHNRLNFELQYGRRWAFEAGLRNRLFYGDLVKLNPAYGAAVEAAGTDWLDLSVNWVDRDQWVLNSTLDRFFVRYSTGDWEMRLGRQRINWGVTNFWNPNDIFNQYLFTDFDYEERPGRDALRLTRYLGASSSVEFAATFAEHIDRWDAAALYKWNRGGYDYQLLAGVHRGAYVLGGAWAGALGQAGLKGEWSLFADWDELSEIDGVLSVEADYAFVNGWYVSAGALYQSTGRTDGSFALLGDFRPSARFLYPYRWTVFGLARYPVSPLLNVGMAALYSPVESHALFLNPSVTYSLAQNWDFDLVVQTVFSSDDAGFDADLAAGFLRLKFSF